MDVVLAVELAGFFSLALGIIIGARKIVAEIRDKASDEAEWRARVDVRLDHIDSTLERHEREHSDVVGRLRGIHDRVNGLAEKRGRR